VTAALEGLRVLDFTRVLAGPFCTMLLADFGAEVIKVENPGVGDDTRSWGPPWAGDPADRMSAYYLSVNRNKRSITINLKTAEGQTLARHLALKSDVLIENFKVGQMQRYGLDYVALNAVHPSLVYCSITGYGQTGPNAATPGYDYVIQGESGLMSITGPADGSPFKVGVAISDVITGLFAANAIQAALRHRDQTGQGQAVDIALLDSQIAALVNVASNFLVSKQAPRRYGNAHPNIVPYEAFDAADGQFILAVGNDGQFRQCCDLIGRADLATDERFANNPARVTHRDDLIALLRPIFAAQPVSHWVKLFKAAGVPVGAINDIPTAFAEPDVQDLVESVRLANGVSVDLLGPTSKLSETPASIQLPPPLLGQHTDQVLQTVLGLDQATIVEYRQRGVI
jgi:crotonobetainyl-CoA:carnitine CoA-transferase CaiB-like acyl-CoA transferase